VLVIDVTDEQIEALMAEAGSAGDTTMYTTCAVALGRTYLIKSAALTPGERAKVLRMSQSKARTECERVISNAKAQS